MKSPIDGGGLRIWLPAVRSGSGADRFTERLAEGLRARGLDPVIDWFALADELRPWRLSLAAPPPGTALIHCNSWHGLWFRHEGLPLVATIHHAGYSPEVTALRTPLRRAYHLGAIRRFERRLYRRTQAVVAVSRYAARSAQRWGGAADVRVIPNGVDVERFSPSPEALPPGGPFRLLFVGNATHGKGADLLEGIARALGPGFELRFTSGKGRAVRQLGPNMTDLGTLHGDALLDAYRWCEALLLPTRAEACPYAVLEAMAVGRPVVASDNTALPELVAHGETGWLCPTADVGALADACRRLAADRRRAAAMGSEARRRACESFRQELCVERYADLYAEVLAAHRRRQSQS
ncbi:MAG: glycosyltransferase family 4 protein [Betaproteobacteria bacterium]|nr:glycosyltransferase family 4 protein [Betaproteobacteria bacterium]